MIDYRNKSMDYDYIIEEFHYEYKLDTRGLKDLLNMMINKQDTEEIRTDYARKYPEVPADELLEECCYNTQSIESYFVGYTNTLELAKLAYAYIDSKYDNDILIQFNEKCQNVNLKAIVKNVLSRNVNAEPKIIKHALYKRFDAHLTVIKNLYIVQSPKDTKTDLPTIHYSLKEKFLSDFRALRKTAKKNMEAAELNNDHAAFVRYNAKQLAIKVICNSEYGASGNATFAHYDPDIAAAITHCARSLIGMLTSNLESPFIYVDQKFLDTHKKDIDSLKACKALTIEHDNYPYEELMKYRRHVIRRIFNDVYELQDKNIYKLILEPAKVIYQDTDSNYYVNYYIQNYFTKNLTECSPSIIHEMMRTMYHHNMLLSDFTTDAIARRPVGLGFEGSFVVCRYLNRKKKYYGRQWSPDGLWFPSYELPNDAYEDGVLKDDYLPFYIKKKTIIPYPDGTYIDINNNALLNQATNYLDYVKSFGCKCTGVDLARRDQYKYINYYHVYILKQDLRIMKYQGNNKWAINDKNMEMRTVINNVITEFKDMFDKANLFVNNVKSNILPEAFERTIKFNLKAFAKTAAYREGKDNTVTKIVEMHEKLDAEAFKPFKPKQNERINYVVINNQAATKMFEKAEIVTLLEQQLNKDIRLAIVNNLINSGVECDVTKINDNNKDYITKLFDKIINDESRTNEQLFEQTEYSTELSMSYEEFYSAFMLAALDKTYYIEKLISAIMLYIIGDLYPEQVATLDEDETLTEAYRNEQVNKLKDKATNQYMIELGLKNASRVKRSINYYEQYKTDTELLNQARIIAKYLNSINKNKLNDENYFANYINNKIFKIDFWNYVNTQIIDLTKEIDDYNDTLERETNNVKEIVKLIDSNGGKTKDFKIPVNMFNIKKNLINRLNDYACMNEEYIEDNYEDCMDVSDFGNYLMKSFKNKIPSTLLYDGFYEFLDNDYIDMLNTENKQKRKTRADLTKAYKYIVKTYEKVMN